VISTEPLTYHDGSTVLDGSLVRPDEPEPHRPGIVIVHGGAGLDDHARGQAGRYADLGHTVLAADMYGRGVPGDRERVLAAIGWLRAEPARIPRRAQAAVDALTRACGVEAVAVIGYCFGGMVALELARAGGAVAGVVSVHGGLSTTRRAAPGAVRARMLVCHGGADPHVPRADLDAFLDEMAAAGADWQLTVHGRALHGFTHDTDDGTTAGVAFDPLADARSHAQIRAFIEELDPHTG
jgi:dienelactone hydrolase